MLYRLVRARVCVCVCDIALVHWRNFEGKMRTVYIVCNIKFWFIFFHSFPNELNVAISTAIANTGYFVFVR